MVEGANAPSVVAKKHQALTVGLFYYICIMEKVNILRACQPERKPYQAGIAYLPKAEADKLISFGLAVKVSEPKKKYKIQEPESLKTDDSIN